MASVEEIQKEYEKRFETVQQDAMKESDEITRDGEKLEKDAKIAFKVDLTVRWSDRKVSLHLPQVTMREQTVSFDLPEVTMHLKEMIFHTPSVRMVPKVVGKYPEFHGLKVIWKDIITHVPETFMEEQRIKMDIPETKMARKEIKLHIPDIRWEQTEMTLRLPDVEIKDISFGVPIDNDDTKQRGDQLKERGIALSVATRSKAEKLAAEMQAEIMAAAYAPARSDAETAGSAYAAQVANVESTIASGVQTIDRVMAEHNLPPEQVAALQASRADILAKGDEARKALSEVGAVLEAEKQEVVQAA